MAAADRITLVPHDPGWADAFERERIALSNALGAVALSIDHHGSTAVPGLAAKPIVDIQVAVARLAPMTAYAGPLLTLGYSHVPHEDDLRCPFFFRAASPPRLPYRCHIHVVESGGNEERRTLAFRDRLRADPKAAREYEELKRRLAVEHDGLTDASMQDYVEGKTDFIKRIVPG